VVEGIQVTAPIVAQATQATVTEGTLPFTGIEASNLAALAAGLAAAGLLALAAYRRAAERASTRPWD
jgi:LPXTG-motif cell wall-anchored protein